MPPLASDGSSSSSNHAAPAAPQTPVPSASVAPPVAAPIPPRFVPAPAAPAAPQTVVPAKSHRKKGVIAAIIVLLVLGAAGGGGYYGYTYYKNHRPYTDNEITTLIREKILPSIVQIRCATEDGGPEAQLGSGEYFVSSSTPYVETNAHVVLGSDGQYHGCNVYFPRPGDGSFYDAAYTAGLPELFNQQEATINGVPAEGMDYALLPLVSPAQTASGTPYAFPPQKPDVYDEAAALCRKQKGTSAASIGDKVYLIGYPGIGGDSVTLTEGVVSGFTGKFDEWIKVSAVTNHGNSGGLAIGAQNGCVYGMPSEATFDQGSNIGYVLDASYIRVFLDGLTGSSTYEPPSYIDEYAAAQALLLTANSYPVPGLDAVPYPDQWTVSTSTDSSGDPRIVFTSPSEGVLDPFDETLAITVGNAGQTTLSQDAGILSRIADDNDPSHLPGKYITIDGKKAYQIIYADSTNFTEPVADLNIEVRNGDTSYFIEGVASVSNPHLQDYLKLFLGMVEDISFAKEP